MWDTAHERFLSPSGLLEGDGVGGPVALREGERWRRSSGAALQRPACHAFLVQPSSPQIPERAGEPAEGEPATPDAMPIGHSPSSAANLLTWQHGTPNCLRLQRRWSKKSTAQRVELAASAKACPQVAHGSRADRCYAHSARGAAAAAAAGCAAVAFGDGGGAEAAEDRMVEMPFSRESAGTSHGPWHAHAPRPQRSPRHPLRTALLHTAHRRVPLG